ncbi:hypothetical protein [Mariniluteicoccus flavus]
MRLLHGIASRHDLPLPFEAVVGGTVAVLVLSFALLGLAWRTPRLVGTAGRPLPRLTRVVDHPATRAVAQLLVAGVWLLVLAALWFGRDLYTNPVFGFVFAWLWVGLVPISLLAGQAWRWANPLERLPEQGFGSVNAVRVGVWPAALGLAAFAWLELVQPDRATLPVFRGWFVAWAIAVVGGALWFGRRWLRAADPFAAYASSLAELSWLRRVDGVLHAVNPLRGLLSFDAPRGLAAVVVVLLGATAYDSFANTTLWIRAVQDSAIPGWVWGTGGLLAMITIVAVTYGAAARAMARWSDVPARDLPRLMAPTVLPICAGYAIAHYFSLLVVEGQRTAIHLSDPLGRGWNLFGSAEMGVNAALFDHPTVTAVVQLVGIVGGHLLGIVAAHEQSLRLVRRDAGVVGQLPMLAVMVFYSCAGLLLLFSP